MASAETGSVGQRRRRLADQTQHGLAGVPDDPADAVEEHEAQPLGPASCSASGRATRLNADSRL